MSTKGIDAMDEILRELDRLTAENVYASHRGMFHNGAFDYLTRAVREVFPQIQKRAKELAATDLETEAIRVRDLVDDALKRAGR